MTQLFTGLMLLAWSGVLLFTPAVAAKPINIMAVASCNKHDVMHGGDIFRSAVRLKSELWVWLGDAVYGDTKRMHLYWSKESEAVKKERYDALRNRSDYQLVMKSTPIIGTWDDHDYGLNDAGKDYPDRNMSQRLYLDFLGEPADSPRRKQAGIYASYSYGEPPNKVKWILIDNRYNREKPGPDADMLGAAQWEWLERELTDSDAAVHLIGNGIQILPEQKPIEEKWSDFPASRTRLLKLIAQTRAPGVILFSGDIHWAELHRTECSPVSYPLYELTTSGMTHSCETQMPYYLCKWGAHTFLHDQRRIAHYTHFNFATVEFDWDERIVTLNLRGPDGDIKFSERIPIALLQPSEREPIRIDWETKNPDRCPKPSPWRKWELPMFIAVLVSVAAVVFGGVACCLYRVFCHSSGGKQRKTD